MAYVERYRAECAHGIDQQLAALLRGCCGDLFDWVENPRARFAMHGDDVRDARIGVEHAFDFVAARRQVVAFVEHRVTAAQIAERGRDALAVGAVGQHECVSVARDQAAEHGFDAVAPTPLQRHAIVVARGVAGDLEQAAAQLRRHRAEIAVPRSPVAQHRFLGRERRGERSRRQQIRLAFGGGRARGNG